MISAATHTYDLPGSAPQSVAWTSWRIRRGLPPEPRAWARQALRTRSPALVDVLARELTQDRVGAAELRAQLLAGASSVPLGAARQRDLALNLATAWAAGAGGAETMDAAGGLFAELWATHGPTGMLPEHRLVAAQTWFLTGRHPLLREALPHLKLRPVSAQYLLADLANPWVAPPGQPDATRAGGRSETTWLELLGRRFVDHDLTPPTLREPSDHRRAEPVFDRLQGQGVAAGSAGGELVSVIMPCYRPDEGLFTSLASITAQSWADVEILLVDDASGPEWEETFAQAAAMDPRVRIVRLERNGGSYLAREAALVQARGSYITFQDADDWSHPRRIEHQLAVLQERGAPISRSDAVRALDDLTHQWLGYSPVRPNASSLLVRREIFESCGGFIPVRKGADSEFVERVETLAAPVADTQTPLAITRLRIGSLSRADFTWSWMAPERLMFRGAYRAWHRELSHQVRSGRTPTLPGADPQDLPFPVPRSFVRALPGLDRTPAGYAQAYVGNLSGVGSTPAAQWLLRQGPTLAAGGEPVGIWTLEAPAVQQVGRPELSEDWFDLMRRHPSLRPLTRSEQVEVGRVVVVDPETLALVTDQECRVSTGAVELWLTPELVEPDSSGLPADVLGLADTAARWWGVRPRWVLAPHLDADQRAQVLAAVPGLVPAP